MYQANHRVNPARHFTGPMEASYYRARYYDPLMAHDRRAASSGLQILLVPFVGISTVLVDSQPFAPILPPGRLAL